MSNYQKFTLTTFKKRLSEGAYSNLTGANRAIGKTKELSDADKTKAKKLAAKHFGEDAPSKSAPAKAARKAAKKAEKKAEKKTEKKVEKAPKSTKKAEKPAKSTKKSAAKGKRAPKEASAPTPAATDSDDTDDDDGEGEVDAEADVDTGEAAAPSRSELLAQAKDVAGLLCTAITTLDSAQKTFPKVELGQDVAAAACSLRKVIQLVGADVVDPLVAHLAQPPAEISLAKLSVPPSSDPTGEDMTPTEQTDTGES